MIVREFKLIHSILYPYHPNIFLHDIIAIKFLCYEFTVIQSTAISILFHILLILFTSHIIMILWLLNFVAITLFKLCSSKVKVVDTNGNFKLRI